MPGIKRSARGAALGLMILAAFPLVVTAQEIPADAHRVSRGKGWTCNQGHVERRDTCIVLGLATDTEIRSYLIQESLAAYPGNCPCPYNTDRAGRQCGLRSAHSRPGGRSPLCYEQDISDDQVRRMRERYPAPKKE